MPSSPLNRLHWLRSGAGVRLARLLRARKLPVQIGVAGWNLR